MGQKGARKGGEERRGVRGEKEIPIICSNIFVCIVTINLKCAGQDRSFEPTSSTACQLKWKCLSFRCNKRGEEGKREQGRASKEAAT